MSRPTEPRSQQIEHVFQRLVSFFERRGNRWFVDQFWPENEARLRMMAEDMLALKSPSAGATMLDIGCFNGFTSFIGGALGYAVTASDQVDFAERRELLKDYAAEFYQANFNELDAYDGLPSESFDVVWMGEVIEHVLTHPLGVMQSMRRVIKPDGVLLLSTPNAANVMNAMRIVRGRSFVRGTRAFMYEPKIGTDDVITSNPEIHYREYVPAELDDLLREAGFRVATRRYLPIGGGDGQPRVKQVAKQAPALRQLLHTRLFGATQYCIARPMAR